MHPSVLDFARRQLRPSHISGADVLEVGSRDINGSLRPYIQTLLPARYVGVDVIEGPGVDVFGDCEHLIDTVGGGWDVVICTEMLEHARHWQTCIIQLVDAVGPGGYLLLTTRSPGFPFHGFPDDYWRFTSADMRLILGGVGLQLIAVEDDEPNTPGVLAFARKPYSWREHADTAWTGLPIAPA